MLTLHTQYGHILELDADATVPVSKSVVDVRTINIINGGSAKFTLPGTKTNNEILGHHYEIGVDSTFNPNTRLFVSLIEDYCVPVMDGYLQLLSVNKQGEDISYDVVIYSNISIFGKDIQGKKLNDFDLSHLDHILNWTGVTTTWTNFNSMHYVYPFVNSNNYTYTTINGTKKERTILYEDMTIGLSVRYLWDQIFKSNNWSYNKEWFDDHLFFNRMILLLGDLKYSELTIKDQSFNGVCSASTNITGTIVANGAWTHTTLDFSNDINNGGFDQGGLWTNATVLGVPSMEYSPAITHRASWTLNLKPVVQPTVVSWGCYLKVNILKNGSIYWTSPVYNFLSGYGDPLTQPLPNDIQITSELLDFQPGNTYAVSLEVGNVNIGSYSLALNVGSTIRNNISDVIGYNDTVIFNDLLEKLNMTQSSFVQSIISMFNLYVTEDVANGYNRHLIFKPRELFYSQGSTKDWTNKLHNDNINIELCSEFQTANIKFSFEHEPDVLQKKYLDKYKVNYTEYIYETGNEFVASDSSTNIKPIFAGTAMSQIPGSYMFAPVTFDLDQNGNAKKTYSKPRILIYNGRTYCGGLPYYFNPGNPENTIQHNTYYAAATTFDNLVDPQFNLSFSTPEEIYINQSGTSNHIGRTFPEDNLRTEYWEGTLTELVDPNSKLITCEMLLSPYDALSISFNDSIIVGNNYYKLNKLDYRSNSLSKVELLKSSNVIPRRRTKTWVKQGVTAAENTARIIGQSNTAQNPHNFIIGSGNFVDENSAFNLIVGDQNVTNINNSIISGFKHSATTNDSIILGGSGNTLHSSKYSMILNGYDNVNNVSDNSTIIASRNVNVSSGSTGSTVIAAQNIYINERVNNAFIFGGRNVTADTATSNMVSLGVSNIRLSSDTTHVQGLVVNELAGSPLVQTDSSGRLIPQTISDIALSISAITDYHWRQGTAEGSLIRTSGGTTNLAKFSTIAGGKTSYLNSPYSFMGGGSGNTIRTAANYSFIGTGLGNYIGGSSYFTSILNGNRNYIKATSATTNSHNTIIAGNNNVISGSSGSNNIINNGSLNHINNTFWSSINNGLSNSIQNGTRISIVNGYSNNIYSTSHAFMGCGNNNIVSGSNRSILFGSYINLQNSPYSFIVNSQSVTINNRSFVNVIGISSNILSTLNLSSNTTYVDALHAVNLSGANESYIGVDTFGRLQRMATPSGSGSTGSGSLISNGLNTYTGGTTTVTSVNISGGSLDNIYVSGNSRHNTLTATTLSATTIYSGSTPLQAIFVMSGQNVGAFSQLFLGKTGANLRFRTIGGGTGISVGTGANGLYISNTGYVFRAGAANYSIESVNNSYVYGASYHSFVQGDSNAIQNSHRALAIGGRNSYIYGSANYSSILAGLNNSIFNSKYSTILAGNDNNILSDSKHNAIIGASSVYIQSYSNYSAIIANHHSSLSGSNNSAIIGGYAHSINNANNSVIIAGNSYTFNYHNSVLVPYLHVNNMPDGGDYMVTWDSATKRYHKAPLPESLLRSSSSSSSIFTPVPTTYNEEFKLIVTATTVELTSTDYVVQVVTPQSTEVILPISPRKNQQVIIIGGKLTSKRFSINVVSKNYLIENNKSVILLSQYAKLHIMYTGHEWIILNQKN